MLAEQVSLALANLQLREQLRSQAIRDQLTGLYNRRFLEDALTRETGRAARSGESVAVAILDVDHFKRINDTHGHEAGDAVLRELGEVLQKTIRKTDIVGRFGGEEFLVLLPGADVEVAQARALGVLEAVRAMQVAIPNGPPLHHITASIGIAVMPLHVSMVRLWSPPRMPRSTVPRGRAAIAWSSAIGLPFRNVLPSQPFV
jgi:diguanylate cyclase (GGDEF)-like protein